MRALILCALAGRCVAADARDAGPTAVTGIYIETSDGSSTGDAVDPVHPRLDLGGLELLTTGESTGGSTGEDSTSADLPTTSGATSTGELRTSTGDWSTSTVEDVSTSAASTSGTSTGGEESTDESTTSEPLTDCPCEDGADNVCDLSPGTCSATIPGGYCDPDGDGAYFDGDFTLGWTEYQAKCD